MPTLSAEALARALALWCKAPAPDTEGCRLAGLFPSPPPAPHQRGGIYEAQQMALSLFQSLWLLTRLRGRGRWGDKGVHKAQVAVRELGTLRRAC